MKPPAVDYAGQLAAQCVAFGLPEPVREYRFDPSRRFRIDLAWPNPNGKGGIAVEVEGGMFNGGGHVTPTGVRSNLTKYNLMTIQGWRLVRVFPEMIESRHMEALAIVAALLESVEVRT